MEADKLMTDRIKIIMDCDPGVDDALALAYAAANSDSFELLAVTSVSGNQSIEKVTRNALDLTEFYGLSVPVARGMDAPLIRDAIYAGEVHGATGLGNCILPQAAKQLRPENAVVFLHKVISSLPAGEQVTLIPTGPLTNIALLLKVFPEVKDKIRQIVFMGGAAMGGNTTPAAEFNIYVDPEAAKIVFRSKIPLVMCGLDATHPSNITREQIAQLVSCADPIPHACGEMAIFSLNQPYNKGKEAVSIHDAVPFVYLLHPEIFTAKKAHLDVDCSEGISRGSTICDFRCQNYEESQLNALVLMNADTSAFQEQLLGAIYQLGKNLSQK